ncbi:hypothetical protein TorRG33x02_084220 [Trema orientale]|uniref:Uncharacterized protein n=1 Tax=Trema orientale TaxID=63057 RepID=A0A2P5FDM7_TREOI|nr:hypothetical protein TorRG33x02_084220 [Trema orientale]
MVEALSSCGLNCAFGRGSFGRYLARAQNRYSMRHLKGGIFNHCNVAAPDHDITRHVGSNI